MSATSFVIPALPQPSIPVAGESNPFRSPHLVRRAQLISTHREMGNDERAPPSSFAKHADMRSGRAPRSLPAA